MRRLIDPQRMLACERQYFESGGVASLELMERAARALADAALRHFPAATRVYIACGSGGNGGYGYACARLLQAAGRSCAIFAAEAAKSMDACANRQRALEAGVPVYAVSDLSRLSAPELWIDCIFGTGLRRAPQGDAAALICRINADRAAGAGVLAADLPSGLNGRTGARYDPCVCAGCTVAFQLCKYGALLQDGLDLCGAIETPDIGFPASAFPPNLPRQLEPDDLSAFLAPRRRNIHKGKCGHLLIIAGSFGMAGAAALCARAALRSGAGLVSIACPSSIVPILQTLAPCAMCVPLAEQNGVVADAAADALRRALEGKSAVVVGCGLTRAAPPAIIEAALRCGLPTVIDADALNILAAHPELQSLLRPCHVLTPHPGEAARLLGRPCADPFADAAALASLGATAVLKGASRVIAGENGSFLSASGACGMARGGAGDAFAGILGALLAEDSTRTAAESAAVACELHGLAGECAQRRFGARGMNAADILDALPEVLQRYVE